MIPGKGYCCPVLVCVLMWIYTVNSSVLNAEANLGVSVAKRATAEAVLCNCVDYKVFTPKKKYVDARQNCLDDGGVLAYIPDNTTHFELKNYILTSVTGADKNKGFWIGLNDVVKGDEYVWETGDILNRGCDFEIWGKDSPNHNTKKGIQQCIQMRIRDDYKWDDDYCSRRKSYICMYYVCPDEPTECTSCMKL